MACTTRFSIETIMFTSQSTEKKFATSCTRTTRSVQSSSIEATHLVNATVHPYNTINAELINRPKTSLHRDRSLFQPDMLGAIQQTQTHTHGRESLVCWCWTERCAPSPEWRPSQLPKLQRFTKRQNCQSGCLRNAYSIEILHTWRSESVAQWRWTGQVHAFPPKCSKKYESSPGWRPSPLLKLWNFMHHWGSPEWRPLRLNNSQSGTWKEEDM